MYGRDIFIGCDDLMCDEELHADYGNSTFAELARYARDQGWSVGRRNHYCPDHRWMARSTKSPQSEGMLG